MLQTPPRKEAPHIVITQHPTAAQSRIPQNPSDESVYRLIYREPTPPLYKSKYAERAKVDVKKGAGTVNKGFQRLETDSTPTDGALKTVPRTVMGLYVSPKGTKTGSVKATPKKEVGSAKTKMKGSGIVARSTVPSHIISKSKPPPIRQFRTKASPTQTQAPPTPIAQAAETSPTVHSTGTQPRLLPQAERLEILAGLNLQHERLSAAYRKLPIVCDLPSKIRRKVELEERLMMVEKEIERFGKTNVVVVGE